MNAKIAKKLTKKQESQLAALNGNLIAIIEQIDSVLTANGLPNIYLDSFTLTTKKKDSFLHRAKKDAKGKGVGCACCISGIYACPPSLCKLA